LRFLAHRHRYHAGLRVSVQNHDELKEMYDPDGRFPDLYAKCVETK
jgi:hypothetical protein